MTFTLFSVVNKLNHWHRQVFKRTSTAPLDIQDTLLERVLNEHDNIVGRFDVSERVPVANLEGVEPEDEEQVARLGAKKNEDGEWVVPEGMDLEPFANWWPLAPEDLRDTAVRMKVTKNGRRIESYVLPEDQAKGNDSLGTITSFAVLPVVAALSFFLWHIHPYLGMAALLLAVPDLIALTQGEGPTDAFRASILLIVLPLWLALSQASVGGHDLQLAASGGPMSLFSSYSAFHGLAMLGGVLVLLFLMSLFGGNKEVGGAWDRIKNGLKWLGIFVLAYAALNVLPNAVAPMAIFAVACMYPMVYTNKNFIARHVMLKEQGELYNQASAGALAYAHEAPRRQQALNAYLDKTPLITLGWATGFLTTVKKFEYAPDKGKPLCISMKDATRHLFIWGDTGIGKTESAMRPTLKSYVSTGYGGSLVTCGKGTLAREVAGLLDVRIQAGVSDLGPFEGLNSQDVAEALFAIGSKDDQGAHKIWEEGAKTFLSYACIIHEALCQHEKATREHAIFECRQLETLITQVQLEIISLEQRAAVAKDEDARASLESRAESLIGRLAELRGKHQRWANNRDAERKWFWTPEILNHVKVICGALEGRDDGLYQIGRVLVEAGVELGFENENLVETKKQINKATGEETEIKITAEQRFALRLATQPQTIHPEVLNSSSMLNSAWNWMQSSWATYAPEQRSSFLLNVDQALNPLLLGRYLTNKDGLPWRSMEHGVDVTDCLRGQHVGIDLPEVRHGRSGRVITALLKQRVYRQVRMRQDRKMEEWMAEGERPCMLFMDECQLLIGREETQLLPIARSLGLMFVMATQDYEGLDASIGDRNLTKSFAKKFKTQIVMESTKATYDFLNEILGKAEITKFQRPTMGIDYDGALDNLRESPLNDVEHPGRGVMRMLERAGAGRLTGIKEDAVTRGKWRGHKQEVLGDTYVTKEIAVPVGGKRVVEDVLKEEEFRSMVVGYGKAFILTNRAGVRRCDIATLPRVGPEELAEKQDEKEAA